MSIISSRSVNRTVGIVATVLVCLAAIASLQWSQLEQLQRNSTSPSLESLNQQDEAEHLRLKFLQNSPTFGYDNLLANWTFLNFLQYFGDEAAREKTGHRLSPEFFEVIIARNPYFLDAYTFLSTSTAIYSGMPERSIALMDKGLASLTPTTPEGSFFVWRNKAIDELLFLGDGQAAKQSFETAAEWADASRFPGSDRFANDSRQTAAFLARNPDSRTAQVAAWAMVLSSSSDERTQQTAIQRINELGGQIVENPDGSFGVLPPNND